MTYESALIALADGTRRELLEHLRVQPLAVGELAQRLRVSQPAVSQHLRVLEQSRLVVGRRDGRRRIYSLSFEGLGELRTYLESFWRDVLAAFAADDPSPPPPATTLTKSARKPTRRARRGPRTAP